MDTSRTRTGLVCMVAAGALLGTLGVPLEEADQHPLTAVWFRCLFGALALGSALAVLGRLDELRLRGRALVRVVAGGLLMLLNWWLFFESIRRTSIALATLVFHLQPFIVMALGAWWLGERVRPAQWAAAGVAVVGLGLVADVLPAPTGTGGIDADEALGLVMCLGGATSYALVVVIAKRAQGVEPPSTTVGAADVRAHSTSRPPPDAPPGPLAIAWWQCAIGTACLAWWPLGHGLPERVADWAWLAALGALNTGLAYALLYAGIARLSTGRIAVLQFIYPLTAVAIDALVYGRALDAAQSFGLVLMLAALLVAVRPSRIGAVPARARDVANPTPGRRGGVGDVFRYPNAGGARAGKEPMFDGIKDELKGETTAGAFAESLTGELNLPSVYGVVLVHADGGRKVNDTMRIEDAPHIDTDSLTSVGDLADAVERAFPDEGISAKLVSPTDADGIGRQMHLKTLRDAA